MFRGEYQHTIDAKGRTIVPAKFREELGEVFFVTRGLENSLFIYPRESWENFEFKLRELPLSNKDVRAFVRFFMSGVVECSLDKQGRILIPQNLRDHAFLTKDAVFIGVLDRIELWDKDRWDDYTSSDVLNAESIAEKMSELGLGI